jgi:hypothetical protein
MSVAQSLEDSWKDLPQLPLRVRGASCASQEGIAAVPCDLGILTNHPHLPTINMQAPLHVSTLLSYHELVIRQQQQQQ